MHSPSNSGSSSTEHESFSNDNLSTALLSGIAGYVDAAGLLALLGLLPAHLTADLVTAGVGVSGRGGAELGSRLLMIPLFVLAVIGTTLVARAMRRRGRAILTPLLTLLTAALAAFMVSGVLLGHLCDGPSALASLSVSGIAVAAMGVQNTIMRMALGSMCPTTVMTGNLTQFTVDLVELVADRCSNCPADARARLRARIIRNGSPVLGFFSGTILGGWLTNAIGLSSIALPTFIAAGLTLISRRASEPARLRRPVESRPSLFPRPEFASRSDG